MSASLALAPGLTLLVIGLYWLYHMAHRETDAVSPVQAMWDFATGSPRDSVLAVGAVLLGLAMAIAALIRL